MAVKNSGPLMIGLVGEKGAGKQTIAHLIINSLPEKTISHMAFSDLLNETLSDWSIPSTRANLQALSTVMRETYGESVLSNAIFHRIQNSLDDIVILDGVRWESDRILIRSFSNNFLVYITATSKIRYNRLTARKQKQGEGSASFTQFMQEEQARTEIEISRIGATSDFKIVNNKTLKHLQSQVRDLIQALSLAFPAYFTNSANKV